MNQRLRNMRTKLSLSPLYMANKLGISQQEYLNFESGSSVPGKKQIEVLENIVGGKLHSNDQVNDESILHMRNGEILSEFDLAQIEKFLAFQKEASNHFEDKSN